MIVGRADQRRVQRLRWSIELHEGVIIQKAITTGEGRRKETVTRVGRLRVVEW
jgi:hypothetical protein